MAEINWDQLPELIENLQDVKKAASKLIAAYNTHHIKINNRINILEKKRYELQHLTNTANRTIARELTRLRALREEQDASQRTNSNTIQ